MQQLFALMETQYRFIFININKHRFIEEISSLKFKTLLNNEVTYVTISELVNKSVPVHDKSIRQTQPATALWLLTHS